MPPAWAGRPLARQSGAAGTPSCAPRAQDLLASAPSQVQHRGMPDAALPDPMPDPDPEPLDDLLGRLREARAAAEPTRSATRCCCWRSTISRRLDEGRVDPADARPRMIARMARAGAADRARRLAAYVGLGETDAGLAALAARLVRPDPEDSPVPFAAFREAVERAALRRRLHRPSDLLPAARAPAPPWPRRRARRGAARGPAAPARAGHAGGGIRPGRRRRSRAAATRWTRFDGALFDAARGVWPDRWAASCPRPVHAGDLGRLRHRRPHRYRLVATRCALRLTHEAAAARRGWRRSSMPLPAEREAIAALRARGARPSPRRRAARRRAGEARSGRHRGASRRALVDGREAALTTPEPLLAAVRRGDRRGARRRRPPGAGGGARGAGGARAGAGAYPCAAERGAGAQRAAPAPRHRGPRRTTARARRGLLAQINAALAEVEPHAGRFRRAAGRAGLGHAADDDGARRSSSMSTAASPIRFLIAETETGYTLLAALWLARRFGIERQVEISPLFETAEALEHGERVLEEALRSPHFRDYLRQHGRLCLQFGYSDSGRYVGQLAATYLVERLKLRLAEQLRRHGLAGIELVLFDTHGESIGRGAHPGQPGRPLRLSLAAGERAPRWPAPASRCARRPPSRAATATCCSARRSWPRRPSPRIAEHAFAPPRASRTTRSMPRPTSRADFFATIRREMAALVEDPGYAALLGAFGPGLLDTHRLRARRRARATAWAGRCASRHPSQLRAIPNNAILQQLGWLREHAARPRRRGARQARCLRRPARHARRASPARWPWPPAPRPAPTSTCCARRWTRSIPAPWLDRAGFTRRPGRREALMAVARALERLGLGADGAAACSAASRPTTWRCAPPGRTLPEMPDRAGAAARAAAGADPPHLAAGGGACRSSARATARRARALLRASCNWTSPARWRCWRRCFPAAPDPSRGLDFGEPARRARG